MYLPASKTKLDVQLKTAQEEIERTMSHGRSILDHYRTIEDMLA